MSEFMINKSTSTLLSYYGNSDYVYVPSGVTSIDDFCFSGNKTIKSVSLPYGLKTISSLAFSNCPSLYSVSFPSSLEHIKAYAFQNCPSLKSVSLPSGCTFDAYAFELYTDVYQSSSYGNNHTIWRTNNDFKIVNNSLIKYTGKSANVEIPSFVTSINYEAFLNNMSVESVTIPNGVKWIGTSAFEGCRRLKSITIPKSVEKILGKGFKGCVSLEKVVLSEGLKGIANECFSGCTRLSRLTLPNSIDFLGKRAFSATKLSLSVVKIPPHCKVEDIRSLFAAPFFL